MGGTSRMTGDGHVRICERPGVKLPRPTRLLKTRKNARAPVYFPDSAFSASATVIIMVIGSAGDSPNPYR